MAEEKIDILQDFEKMDLKTIDSYIKKYPWFSILHIIWLLKIKKEKPGNFDSELKKHIVFFRDRKKIYQIVTNDIWYELVKNTITSINQEEKNNPGKKNNPITEKDLLEFDTEITRDDGLDNAETKSLDNNNSEPPLLEDNPEKKTDEPNNSSAFSNWIDEVDNSKQDEDDLIEKFLEIEPGPIRADKKSLLKGDMSEKSVEENESFITDTLAKIYIKQGLYSKAIFAYKKLSLKYPEKSVYFASQIEEIRKLINN